jgi:uncharacterized protein GlcG (DUF336 family)
MSATSKLTKTPHAVSVQTLSTDAALAIAQRSVQLCRDKGFAVASTVVDRSGNVLAALRDNNAGPATLDGSRRKAYTAINMGMPSSAVEKLMRDDVSLRTLGDISGFLPLQGGVSIKIGEQIVGAVGIGGATGAVDESCALVAIAQVLD